MAGVHVGEDVGTSQARVRWAVGLLVCAAGAFSAHAAPVRASSAPAAVAREQGPVPAWKRVASASVAAVSPTFEIAGQTLRVPDDLPAILEHYRRRPPHDYTVRWMQNHVWLERNRAAGRALLEQGQLQYGSYAPVPFSVADTAWTEDPFSNLNWQWSHHQLMTLMPGARNTPPPPPR